MTAGAGAAPGGQGPWDVVPRPRPVLPRVARAYCGPAHGRTWPLVTEGPPPSLVDVPLDTDSVPYRLVHHPRTRRPVRDHAGSYLYMPVRTVQVGPVLPSIDLDIRLPVHEHVRALVVQACDEPVTQDAFGVGATLTPR